MISRDRASLQVSYTLRGDIARLRIPSPKPPRFAEKLWQHTCCEVFVSAKGADGYREFNLSPSGEWAAYAFERYRKGAPVDETPQIAVRQQEDSLELTARVPLSEKGTLKVGLSAVIEDDAGALSYWALRHAPGKPDFHHRDAFALELE